MMELALFAGGQSTRCLANMFNELLEAGQVRAKGIHKAFIKAYYIHFCHRIILLHTIYILCVAPLARFLWAVRLFISGKALGPCSKAAHHKGALTSSGYFVSEYIATPNRELENNSATTCAYNQ